MSDKMYPIPFHRLLDWIKLEFSNQQSLFGIPANNFYRVAGAHGFAIGNQTCSRPFGPAAGPHTQMAQNIIAAYLTGARFFELKTVQIMDNLEIAKPCIAAEREGYNTEWSTEFSVPQAFDEYLKAWLLIPLIRKLIGGQLNSENDTSIFNMSVGYNLAGIQSSKIDRFIETLKSAESAPQYAEYHSLLLEKTTNTLDKITVSPNICNSITLSTMHGCPPDEIEAIAGYLLTEKRLHTYVKLNPTLLGFDFVRIALDRNGFGHVQLKPASFEHDLHFEQAKPMLTRLQALAKAQNLTFGVKLSNTLPVINSQGKLPGDEMYMSGQALFPLTINLAFRLAQTFGGELPISFSGGADALNIGKIYTTGIAPITVATNLLKPGGYLRLKQQAEEIDKHTGSWKNGKVDLDILGRLADQVLHPNEKKVFIEVKPAPKADRDLPLFDCFFAPCQERCPIHQDVATYLRQIQQGNYDTALTSILAQNPLPNITGHICDHQCMSACTRNYYDNPVAIRTMKRIAAEAGRTQSGIVIPANASAKKVAVIGAGPAGLATAFFLQKAGLSVTVFDRNPEAGGTVRFIIPGFRLPLEAIECDIQFIASQGVRFIFGQQTNQTVEELRQKGFEYIVLAIGAGISPIMPLQSGNPNIIEAVEFLKKYNQKVNLNLGRAVAIVGGGNSAMDAARAACRIPGVEEVLIVYRRTIAQMPADREELENALIDRVVFRELINPVAFSQDGILKCQRMKLGEPDASGRPRPVPVDEFEDLRIDTLITAIGEQVDQHYLQKIGLNPDRYGKVNTDINTNETDRPNVFIGGDANRGPATVVEAIADGRKIATAILSRENITRNIQMKLLKRDSTSEAAISIKKGQICPSADYSTSDEIKTEAGRCLECDLLCMRCVDICPNRANVAVSVKTGEDGFKNIRQIVHLDALCNECGNCATFCLYENGRPYRDKFTIFQVESAFVKSQNDGLVRANDILKIRLSGQVRSFEPQNLTSAEMDYPTQRQALDLLKTLLTNYQYLLND